MPEAVIKAKIAADASQFNAGVRGAEKTADGFKARMENVGKTIKQAFGAGAVAAFAQALGAAISESKQLMEGFGKISDLALEFGISEEGVQALQLYAEQSGQTADAFLGMIAKVRDFQDSLGQNTDEAAKAQVALAGLGIAVERFSGLSPGDAFIELSEALARYEGDGNRAATVFDILGAKGRRMQGLLTDLGKQGGLEGLAAKFGEQGAIMSGEEVRRMDAVGDREAVQRRAAQIIDARAATALTGMIQQSGLATDLAQGMRGGLFQAAARGFTRAAGAMAGTPATDVKPVVDEQRKTNTALERIAKNTEGGAKF